MVHMNEFFHNLRRQGHDLENAIKDLSDVNADGSLANSPAVRNLISKVQFVMDRACTKMKYTQEEQDQVQLNEDDLKFYRDENGKLALVTEAHKHTVNDLSEKLRSRDEIIDSLQREIGQLKYASLQNAEISVEEKALCDSGKLVESIIQLRKRTGLGLKEAKDKVEAYRDGKNKKGS